MAREKGDLTDVQLASCASTLLAAFLSMCNPGLFFASHTLIGWLFGWRVADFPFLPAVVSAVLGACAFLIAVVVLLRRFPGPIRVGSASRDLRGASRLPVPLGRPAGLGGGVARARAATLACQSVSDGPEKRIRG